MAKNREPAAAATYERTAAIGLPPVGRERDLVCQSHGLRVALSAKRLSQLEYGLRSLSPVDRVRSLAADQRLSAGKSAARGGAKALSNRGIIDSQSTKTAEAGGPRGPNIGF